MSEDLNAKQDNNSGAMGRRALLGTGVVAVGAAALGESIREVPAASFGIPVSAFADVPTEIKPVMITRHR